ncbi:hypothetical protein [Bradyrhizobium sp. CCBAU 45389]|uniref:hypothetical protein n=1 Tax=Bradyrhizobium sp. CCBAU 45389 TaxID=858429 RepID=UPI002305FBD4|nr:hypothetical protein [Bradyrhizobium sp. CCBAU 45389]
MTRRAKHRQNDIIETSLVHPRGDIRRGFFRLDVEIGRRRRIAATHSLDTRLGSADWRAVVRTIAGRARANVPARGAGLVARAAAVSGTGDRVRARNDRASLRDLPRISFRGEMMTAYLISLALAGLVAIALWEMLS